MIRVDYTPLSQIQTWDRNPKDHDLGQLHQSMNRWGYVQPVLLNEDSERLVAGHGRLETLAQIKSAGGDPPEGIQVADDGDWLVPVIRGVSFASESEAEAYGIADNQLVILGGWDDSRLAEILSDLALEEKGLEGTGYDTEDLDDLLLSMKKDAYSQPPENPGSLAETFGAPPFSVLDARQGYWQTRKREWLSLGIQSEQGRHIGNTSTRSPEMQRGIEAGGSVFDPVLCELAYRWFCPPSGKALDPFAGGSVRGIVAASKGVSYTGIDLRSIQIDANRAQWKEIGSKLKTIDTLSDSGSGNAQEPTWIHGDSSQILPTLDPEYDIIFSCPPYADLEVYSDHPDDLSNMDYADFIQAYADIIQKAVGLLRDGRFAVWVVGDLRGPNGSYRGLVRDTVTAFEKAGLALYNDAVLLTPLGSLPVRAGKTFKASRKLGKAHQNVLVFVKGDPKDAHNACGPPASVADDEG